MVKVNPLLDRVSSAKAAAPTVIDGKGLDIDPKARDAQWKLEGRNKSGRPHKGRKAKYGRTKRTSSMSKCVQGVIDNSIAKGGTILFRTDDQEERAWRYEGAGKGDDPGKDR